MKGGVEDHWFDRKKWLISHALLFLFYRIKPENNGGDKGEIRVVGKQEKREGIERRRAVVLGHTLPSRNCFPIPTAT